MKRSNEDFWIVTFFFSNSVMCLDVGPVGTDLIYARMCYFILVSCLFILNQKHLKLRSHFLDIKDIKSKSKWILLLNSPFRKLVRNFSVKLHQISWAIWAITFFSVGLKTALVNTWRCGYMRENSKRELWYYMIMNDFHIINDNYSDSVSVWLIVLYNELII